MKIKHYISFILPLVLGALSCQPNIRPVEDEEPEQPDSNLTEVIPNGDTVELEFEAQSRWSFVNSNDWIYITPAAGVAGKAKVKVVVEENSTLVTRQGSIYLIDGARTTAFRFVQESQEIVSTDNSTYYAPEKGGFEIRIKSTVGYTLTTDTDWIVLPSQTHFDADANERSIQLDVKDNTSSSERHGGIIIIADSGMSFRVMVHQAAHVDVSWNSSFYKRSLVYRFTGDWCGYCPYLEYDLKNFRNDYPDRVNVICFYDMNSADNLLYTACGKYENRFFASDKPTMVVDERGYSSGVSSPEYYRILKDVVEESRKSFGANTAITIQSSVADGKLSVHPTVYVKEEGDYNIHVALLESGIVAAQQDYTGIYTQSQLSKFVHDDVVRGFATTLVSGNAFHADAKSANGFNFTMDIPANVKNENNLSVVVYITRNAPGGPYAVVKFVYYSDRPSIVDNCVAAPVGQSTTLKYE